jgi:competence protein ComEA
MSDVVARPLAFIAALLLSLFSVVASSAQAQAPVPVQAAAPVDLNSATQAQLEGLKGIGPANAKKIIAGRPYQSVDELVGKGVPAKTVEAIRPMVTVGGAKPAGTTPVAKAPSPRPTPVGAAPASGPVDLNTASETSLESLPGVGPATAKAIIAGRPFANVDDLAKVKGIGPAKLAAMRAQVTVSSARTPPPPPAPLPPPRAPTGTTAPATTTATPKAPPAAARPSAATAKLAPGQRVNLNTATTSELEALPGIGPVKAQKIVAGRPYGKIEDVMKVSGIKQGIFQKIKDSITVQ